MIGLFFWVAIIFRAFGDACDGSAGGPAADLFFAALAIPAFDAVGLLGATG